MQPANNGSSNDTTQITNENVQTTVDTVIQITDPPAVVTATPLHSNQSATCMFKHEKQNCLSLPETYENMQFSDRISDMRLRPNTPKQMKSHCFARA